jgi:hypothetical protein
MVRPPRQVREKVKDAIIEPIPEFLADMFAEEIELE